MSLSLPIILDLAWTFATFTVYSAVLVCLNRLVSTDQDFGGSFFKFVINLGAIDQTNAVVKLWFTQLGQWGMFLGFYRWCSIWLAKVLMFAAIATNQAQHICVLIIAIDRFLQFLMPVSYQKWSNPKWVKMSCAFSWLVPLLISSPVLGSSAVKIVINETENTAKLATLGKNDIFMIIAYIPVGILTFSVALIVFVLYTSIFVKASFLYKEIRTNSAQKIAFLNVLIGFSISLCLFVFVAFLFIQISRVQIGPLTPKMSYVVFYIVGSLYYGANPYCLILFSPKFRAKFLEFVWPKSQNRVMSVQMQK